MAGVARAAPADGILMVRVLARVGAREIPVEVERRSGGYVVRVAGAPRAVEARRAGAALLLTIDGRALEAFVVSEGAVGSSARAWAVTIGPRTYGVRLADPLAAGRSELRSISAGRAEVRAIMPGRVAALLVREGQEVRAGQGLVVVEAMKMENEIPSPRDGRVTVIAVRSGATVEAGALLATVE